jgi:hypothetical protein
MKKIKILENLYCTDYNWLHRNIKKGEILNVYVGATYNCISKNGIAVTELTDPTYFFEIPISKIEFIDNFFN